MIKFMYLELQVSQFHQSPSHHPLPHPQATYQGSPSAAGPAQDSNRFFHENNSGEVFIYSDFYHYLDLFLF